MFSSPFKNFFTHSSSFIPNLFPLFRWVILSFPAEICLADTTFPTSSTHLTAFLVHQISLESRSWGVRSACDFLDHNSQCLTFIHHSIHVFMLEITDSSVALSAKGRLEWGEVLTFLRPQPTPWTFLTDCCSYFFGFQIISVNYALFKDV